MTLDKQPPSPIHDITKQLLEILREMESIPGCYDAECASMHEFCCSIDSALSHGRLKMAVVGVIKSGKSTFVNALIGKDIVKRGAGVITSITTRIRKGRKNRATIYFKSWDQINTYLENALAHCPEADLSDSIPSPFDLRRKNDRALLKRLHLQMEKNLPVSSESLIPEILGIRHAIKGFESCQTLVQADECDMAFDGKEFERHKEFTTDADKAFFLNDVLLEIYGKFISPDVEIADCQGSDSTDPASLEQVLNYLDQANMIVYCISSRNGLRSADIKFLNKIKKMGLLSNIVFINNCDLTEHDTLTDLIKVENTILQDLSYLTETPELYTFSCLYHLFENNLPRLSKKDESRLAIWQDEKKMVDHCSRQFEKFMNLYTSAIEERKQKYLVANHLGRLGMILKRLDQRTGLFLEVLSVNADKKKEAQQRLKRVHLNASRLESIVSNSIDAAISGLRKEIHHNIDTAFANDGLKLVQQTKNHIDQIPIDIEACKLMPDDYGFNQIIYQMFQDFRRNIEQFVVEIVNPEIRRFIKEQEEKIESHFQFLLDSYQIDLEKSGEDNKIGAEASGRPKENSVEIIDIIGIKEIIGVQPPARIFKAIYSSRVKAGIFTGFGLSTLAGFFSAVIGRQKPSFSPGLEKAARTMKLQTKRHIILQNNEFQSSLTQHYFNPMIDAAAREFKKIIKHRFAAYKSMKHETEKLIKDESKTKEIQQQKVIDLRFRIEKIQGNIAFLLEECLEKKVD